MKAIVIMRALLLALPLSANAATVPYKEVRNEAVRSKQPVVYARVTDSGFGVQYRRDSDTGYTVGIVAGGLAGGLLGTAADKLVDSKPTKLAEQDAKMLASLLNRAAAQRDLELALAESLGGVPVFATPVQVNALPPGAPTDVSAFNQDPVLVVELYASLVTHYRGLQVTALAYELSPSQLAANPKAPNAGRVYRNRFDYISAQLPAPHVKTKEEIEADVAAVKARYQGRRLDKQGDEQRRAELKAAAAGTTLEKFREPLLAQWMDADGAKLHEALQAGTKAVAQLLARDMVDFSAVEIRKAVGTKDWGSLRDSTADRQLRVYFGGPFAGAVVSQPGDLRVSACQGIAFKDSVSAANVPKLCIL